MDAARPAKLDVRGVTLVHYNERTQQALRVLDGIDLQVGEGEVVSIVGPSGCGKTTFLNAVDGLARVTSGEIRLDGRVVDRPGPDRAFVFQHDSLFPSRLAVSLAYRTAERELRPRAAAPARQGRDPRARAAADRAGRAQGFRAAFSPGAVGRHAPALQYRALPRGRARAPAARRAVCGTRRADARVHAVRADE